MESKSRGFWRLIANQFAPTGVRFEYAALFHF